MISAKGKAGVLLSVSAVLALAACGGGSSTASGSGGSSSVSGKTGGTLYALSDGEKITHLDPQRNYTGDDLNFAGSFLQRTLTAYKVASGTEGTKIVPDLATDTGTQSDEAKTWKFTLRDGSTFEDGSAITCADVKYGVSRTFATDVITDGPTYAISMLDIAKDAKGASIYTGPYKSTDAGKKAFDKAVECSADGKTITFHLSRSVPDFNYATTLLSFSPVPAAKDTGEKYDMAPVASGPYKIESYKATDSLVLVRNTAWKQSSDPVRKAYPDKVVVKFSVQTSVIDQRLLADAGDDQTAVGYSGIDSADLTQIFSNPSTTNRRSDGYDPFVRYYAINTKKVPNVKHRQALMVALDRAALLKLNGGKYAGDLADGVIKPNIGEDYAATGLWTGLLGQAVPDSGDVAFAKKLIADSGETPPTIVFDYGKAKGDDTADKAAAIVKTSWEAAGFTVKLNPIEASAYYPTVLDPAKQGSVSGAGWGPDWLNASTVIPELLTPTGGFPLSQYDDKTFVAAVDKAKTTLDRSTQATEWQALNKQAVQDGLVIPTRFGKEQLIFGSKIKTAVGGGKPYSSAAFGGPNWGDLYVAS